MIKIHVDTTALAENRPAILVVPPDTKRRTVTPTMFVQIHCPCCNAKTATVEQQANTAHVFVPKLDQIETKETP